MEVADYLKVLRRRWWMVALAVLVCTGAAGAFDATRAPTYQTTTRLLVAGASAGGVEVEDAARQLASARAGAYAQLVETGPGLAIATDIAGPVSGANPEVQAEATPGTPFITVTVTADSAQGARALADAYPAAIPRIVRALEQAPASAMPTIAVLEPPVLPTRPASPRPLRDLPIAVVLGLVLGLASALLRESLDARIRDAAEAERVADAALLGTVPREHSGKPLPSLMLPRSGRAEAYRHVRTNLEFAGPGGMPASVVVTSASPGEGKSSLAANLAVMAAQAGRDVVIVDADLRKPSMSRYFGVTPPMGLTEVLSGQYMLDHALVPIAGTRVVLLPSGGMPSYPSELVGSAGMVHLIEELERRFDLVVIDTPPVLPVSDALLLGVHVQGVVIVARMGETRRAALKRAVESVRKVNATVLGVVANAVVRHEEKAYGNTYGYGYGGTSRQAAPLPVELAPAGPPRDQRAASSGRRGRRAAGSPPAVRPPVRPVADSWAGSPSPGLSVELPSDRTAELPIVAAMRQWPAQAGPDAPVSSSAAWAPPAHIDIDNLPPGER